MDWFTSDTHFNHGNIIRYCSRPFADVGEMNTALIERWNNRVKPDDTIYHLGDFAFGPKTSMKGFFDLLNGKKILIVGNHDPKLVTQFEWAGVYASLPYGDSFQLIHNPDGVNAIHAGKTILHGHLHGTNMDKDTGGQLHPVTKLPHTKYVDVGVDCWDYYPISLDTIINHLTERK